MKKEDILDKEAPAIPETDLDEVTGGKNPFQDKKRIDVNDYDEDIKERV